MNCGEMIEYVVNKRKYEDKFRKRIPQGMSHLGPTSKTLSTSIKVKTHYFEVTPHHKDLVLKKVKCPPKLTLEKKNLEISPHEPYILSMLPTLSSKFFNVTITKDKDCSHLILKLYKKN